jgi:XTP/dITP diphosphohydrolase
MIVDGESFDEHSIKKAKTVMDATGAIAIADDSGLEVEALNNAPGIYSARFSGEGATDEKNNEKLIELLKAIPYTERGARFVSAIAMVFPSGQVITVRGECEGIIGFEARGNNGFGYDPYFIVPEYDKTFGELGSDVKNKISHRAKALALLKAEIKKIF